MAKKTKTAVSRSDKSAVNFENFPGICKSLNFKYDEFEGGEHDPPTIQLLFPTEREPFKRWIWFGEDAEIANLVAVHFERFGVASNYVSIIDMTQGTIEARVTSNGYSGDAGVAYGFKEQFPVHFDRGNIRVSIKESSAALRAVHREYRPEKQYSVVITGLPFQSLDESSQKLVEITDALFFSLELNDGISLSLVPKRSFPTQGLNSQFTRIIERQNRKGLKTTFPTQKYDPVPMNLFRYGIHASRFPLLRYLAFYQVLEYYFPVCANTDAVRRIQWFLKDPRFDANSMADITKILTVTPPNHQKDRDMFNATIRQCVDLAELYSYLTEDDDRKDWFGKPITGITDQRLGLTKSAADALFSEVVNRVYSIRCAIVHTKSNNVAGFLQPLSNHERELYHDTELVRFLATKVLIHQSEKLI